MTQTQKSALWPYIAFHAAKTCAAIWFREPTCQPFVSAWTNRLKVNPVLPIKLCAATSSGQTTARPNVCVTGNAISGSAVWINSVQ